MIRRQIQAFFDKRRATLLGIGPMSRNCVDAVIEIANDTAVPLMLVASRRQIECAEMGGGYVERWHTDEFAKYVRERDLKGRVYLARDHGGPWQHPREVEGKYALRNAMESAKASFDADIRAGFDIIHVDASMDIHTRPSSEELLFRIYELMEHCWITASGLKRNIAFEIGAEEQSGGTSVLQETEELIAAVMRFCRDSGIGMPLFVVTQTGTRVMELRNIGTFDSPIRIAHEMPTETYVSQLVDICNRYGVYMKQHNTDYLSDTALRWHPRLGIHSANVAPEFGTTESIALIEILRANGLDRLAEEFLDMALKSGCWKKWILPESPLSDEIKAILAGHYLFATEPFLDVKRQATRLLARKNIELDQALRSAIRNAILRYLIAFRLRD